MLKFFRKTSPPESETPTATERLRRLLPCLSSRSDSSLCPVLILATILAMVVPALTAKIIFPAFADIMVEGIREDAQRLGHLVMPPSLKHTRIEQALLGKRFFAEIYKLEHDFGLMKVKIFSHTGETLYSTNTTEEGTVNSHEYFQQEVAKGVSVTRLVRQGTPTLEGYMPQVDVVETYVPFMSGDQFLGAFEMYYDVTERTDRMDRLGRSFTLMTALLCSGLVILLAMLTFKDVTQQRAQREAETLKEDVERITRHDLKAPIAGIIGGTNFLSNYTKLNEEQAEMVEELRHTANMAMDLINRGLDLYRMESGKYRCDCEMTDMVAIVNRVVRDLADQTQKSNVKILKTREGKESKEGDSLHIVTDSTLVYSLLANLVKNAIEASDMGQQVTINVSGEKGLRLTVHNQQPVPEDIRDTFFDKYRTMGKTKGTGLGTYSAKLIAETLGGTISMQSSKEKGTLLVVTLPEKPSPTIQ